MVNIEKSKLTREDEKVIAYYLCVYYKKIPRDALLSIEEYFRLVVSQPPFLDRLDIISILELFGSNVDYVDENGENLAFHVISGWDFEQLKILKKYGFDITRENVDGMTIFDIYLSEYDIDTNLAVESWVADDLIEFENLGFDIQSLNIGCEIEYEEYKQLKFNL